MTEGENNLIPEFGVLKDGTVMAMVPDLTDDPPWSVITFGCYSKDATGLNSNTVVWAASDCRHCDGIDHDELHDEAISAGCLPEELEHDIAPWGGKLDVSKNYAMYERSAGRGVKIDIEVLDLVKDYFREVCPGLRPKEE